MTLISIPAGCGTSGARAHTRLMASRERDLCRQVAQREWDECRTTARPDPGRGGVGGGGGDASGLPIGAKRHYIAAVTCGFLGFAPRPRKQRLAGAPPRLGAVVFDSSRFFRHQAQNKK